MWVRSGKRRVFPTSKKIAFSAAFGKTCLLGFFVAFLAVPQSQTYADGHESNRRKKEDNNPPGNRVLTFFVKGARCAVAHGTALSDGGNRPKSKQQGQNAKT